VARELQDILDSGELTNILMGLGYNPTADLQVATFAKVEQLVQEAVLGDIKLKGTYDALNNVPDLDVAPGAISAGSTYIVNEAGTFFTLPVLVGDTIVAIKDFPTVEADWVVSVDTVGAAATKVLYESNIDTNVFTDAEKAIVASITQATINAAGIARIATQTEVNSGVDNTTFVTPLTLATFSLDFNLDGGRADSIMVLTTNADGGNA